MRLLVEGLAPVPARPGDCNRYQEGWLPSTDPDLPHAVVLALLSQDSTGNASAVCADMFHSYPWLECVVICGIAGGIPNLDDPQQHVRLGDIVVAEEIVSYGHVRRVEGNEVLRRPTGGKSADLSRAVNELRIGDLAGSRPWRAWLGGTDPQLAQFSRPADETDVLYVAGSPVAHPDPTTSGHEAGWPKIHYGPVGSADVLLRDEIRRDDLAASHKLLAVEMEASGIASAAVLRNRAWFVVRGIVDYCENTGKNDAWHMYGSLAAAAYVRALLEACHPFGVASAQLKDNRPTGIKIEVLDLRIYYNTRAIEVDFSILNTSNRHMSATGLSVEVLQVEPLERYSVTKPAGLFNPMRYEVTLDPSLGSYRITRDRFMYEPNERDDFTLKVHSAPGWRYLTRISATYLDLETEQREEFHSAKLSLEFPKL